MLRTCARIAAGGLALVLLSACTPHAAIPTQTPQGVDTAVFTSSAYHLRMRYPSALRLRHDFQAGYLAADHWETYAGANPTPGQPLVALILPASNAVTSGELRIGVSRNDKAVRHCTDIPAAALDDSIHTTTIDGVRFTAYKARDAGMSHYLRVRSYRGVHAGTCYALDVLVYGTNPRVYEPPKTPPFTAQQVFDRLTPIVANLQFTHTG